MAELPSGTVTFLFTDVEGSTRLLKLLGRDRYEGVLGDSQRILRAAFAAHGGRVVDTQGDSFFVAFRTAKDAVWAAADAQRDLAAHEWPEDAQVRVRMGLHTGEPKVGEERYVGIGVHRAARIGAVGHGGQVLLSWTTKGLAEEDLPPGVAVRDLGERRLRDIDQPQHLYQLELEGLPSEFGQLRTLDVELRRKRRRMYAGSALIGVLAAAVAIPVFALGQGGSGEPSLPGIGANSVGVIDAGSNSLTHEVPVGVNPTAVAAGGEAVWVTNADDHTVKRIDPETNTVSQTIRVGNGASGVAVGGEAVWVANSLAGTLSRIDPATSDVVDTIDVGSGPGGVAFGQGSVWVANAGDGTVSRVNPASGRPVKTFPVGGGADGIAVGAGSLWVTNASASTVSRIDPQTYEVVAKIGVGNGPSAIAVGPDAVWVANGRDGTVSRIDPARNAVTAVVQVGEGPSGIAAGDGAVWVSSEFAGTVTRIDPATTTVTKTVPVGNRPQGLAVAGASVYLAVRAGAASHRGGTIRFLVSPQIKDLRVAVDPALWNSGVQADAYDGLVAFRRVGGSQGAQIVPDLATAMPNVSDGGRTYAFQLRRRIRYSNGKVLKPDDLRYGLERLFKLKSYAGPLYGRIVGGAACLKQPKTCDLSRGIVADNSRYTVTFHLVAADPEFLYKLAIAFVIPVPVGWAIDGSGKHVPPTTSVTMLASASAKQLTYARNPYFRVWSEAARPDRYTDKEVFTLPKSTEAALKAVEQGKAEVAEAFDLSAVSAAALRKVKTRYRSHAHFEPFPWTLYLILNTKVPPFDDIRVRQALNYAVDRREVARLWGGPDTGLITCQILPPNFPGYRRYCPYTLNPNRSGIWTAPDLTKAKRLVAASGTKRTPVVLHTFTREPYAKISRYLASVLRSLGYRVRLRVEDFRTKEEYWATRRSIGAYLAEWFANYPAPSDFINSLLSCGSIGVDSRYAGINAAQFCDRRIDAQIKRALALGTSDPAAANALWARIDHAIVDQTPWVTLLNPQAFDFVSKRVGNYQYHPWWRVLLDQMWVR